MAQAEPQPAVAALMHYGERIVGCLERAETAELAQNCIGISAGICMSTETDGFTTLGMAFCLSAEREVWDDVLNRTYQDLISGMRRVDAQEADTFPEFANREDSLRAAQRAWIPLRDADCSLEYALWGAGSMRQIAGAGCMLDRTAERVIYLTFLGHDMKGENP